jgi:hypothetical protein
VQKVTVQMRIAVHPIKAKLWQKRALIKPSMTLREIGKLIGVNQPQQVKHHLESMVAMGAVDYIEGLYVFPKE